MATRISPLSFVDSRANIDENVTIGPFCYIGPHVSIGAGTQLDNHVTITGKTIIGKNNRFWPNAVIGAEPQDVSYSETETSVEIGDNNIFREGVTVNRGAEKEDYTTRIGNGNMLMANAHVAHNCRIYNNVILVNGVLLGGHVHVQDGAIVSGNSVVHHFTTVGTLAFVSGGCRVPHDVPPYMLAAGSDKPEIKTINVVGLRRAGISEHSIGAIKRAHRLIFRDHKSVEIAREHFLNEFGDLFPFELTNLFNFLERQSQGKMGRAREAIRNAEPKPSPADTQDEQRRAA
ncbi:MAG: acyl-ACP--UDP-N-acetylglucosamine O-acyltransferase [Planctomycetaceae bacterium]